MKTEDLLILAAAAAAVAAMVKFAKSGALSSLTTGRAASSGSGLKLPWAGFDANQYYNVWGGGAVSGVVSAENPYGAINAVDAATLAYYRDGM